MNQQVREIISYLDMQIKGLDKLKEEYLIRDYSSATQKQIDDATYKSNTVMAQVFVLEQVKNWILKEFSEVKK